MDNIEDVEQKKVNVNTEKYRKLVADGGMHAQVILDKEHVDALCPKNKREVNSKVRDCILSLRNIREYSLKEINDLFSEAELGVFRDILLSESTITTKTRCDVQLLSFVVSRKAALADIDADEFIRKINTLTAAQAEALIITLQTTE